MLTVSRQFDIVFFVLCARFINPSWRFTMFILTWILDCLLWPVRYWDKVVREPLAIKRLVLETAFTSSLSEDADAEEAVADGQCTEMVEYLTDGSLAERLVALVLLQTRGREPESSQLEIELYCWEREQLKSYRRLDNLSGSRHQIHLVSVKLQGEQVVCTFVMLSEKGMDQDVSQTMIFDFCEAVA